MPSLLVDAVHYCTVLNPSSQPLRERLWSADLTGEITSEPTGDRLLLSVNDISPTYSRRPPTPDSSSPSSFRSNAPPDRLSALRWLAAFLRHGRHRHQPRSASESFLIGFSSINLAQPDSTESSSPHRRRMMGTSQARILEQA